MKNRWFSLLAALLLTAGAAPSALAALADLGIPMDPHGFPQFYEDGNGLALELCLPPPVGNATAADTMCIFEVDAASPLGVGGENFWYMASASIDLGGGASAFIEFAIEATFAGIGAPVDGQQISFGRTRIRIDTPTTGTYTVTHPYGVNVFEVTDAAAGINYTSDIGSANFFDPANGFRGTLAAPIGPFLTWPDFATNPALQVLAGDGVTVLEQYVGDPATTSAVVGSPTGNNFFQVQGPGLDVQTDQFFIMGKVLDPNVTPVAHVFPLAPANVLFAVGPVNRVTPFATPTTGTVTGVDIPDYPLGFPIWYQENVGTIQAPVGGVKVTLCTPGDAMCISDPIDPANQVQVDFRTGGENFWWSSDARINIGGTDRALLVLGLEGTFGGAGDIIDGQQIAFGRERIRVDTQANGGGTYRITHPYGQRIFENVPAAANGINFPNDIGIMDPADPDGGFAGALTSTIGPTLLKWTTFNANPALTDPALVKPDINNPAQTNYFVGDPAIAHAVTGSPTGNNFFRVEKFDGQNWVLIGETNLFNVSGQVYDPTAIGFLGDNIGVLRSGRWFLDTSGDSTWGVGDTQYQFGVAGDIPVVGDWDGNGTSQIGVFRNGVWYLDTNGDGAWGAGDTQYRFGIAGDTPVVGDWNGDGTSQIGVFRNGVWYLDASGDGAWGAGDTLYRFGIPGDKAFAGDWNGDGRSQIGVLRNNRWFLDVSGDGVWGAGDTQYLFGAAGDTPIIGDWDGNGTSQIGVFRSGGIWYIDANGDGIWNTADDRVLRFGITGDLPVAGQW